MAVTFGSATAPSQKTVNLDALFAQTYAAYPKKKIYDNIASTNALLHKILDSDMYESQDGGTHIEIGLMYELAVMRSYDGYDELSTPTIDGVTNAIAQWRQSATGVSYSEKERKQNKHRLHKMVATKLDQARLGMQEGFATKFMQGAGSGSLTTAATDAGNGSAFLDPLPLLIAFDPTTSVDVLNINQANHTWWRNKTKTSAATTYDGFMLEIDNFFNTCSLGTGGPPDMGLVDQVTHELFAHAMYQKFRQINRDQAFQFNNLVYREARFVMDEKVPDVFSGTTSYTYGTMYFINSQFFHMFYESETDFILTDFQKPVNQDARVANILWMGAVGVSNRRKQGVFGKIARSYAS